MEQQIRFCTSPDGIRIAYATAGQGPPLVKAANWLSHLEFDWNSPVWRHWLMALAGENTLVRYDERGCGLSDWEVADFSLDAWVQDLETVVTAAGLDRFPLLGISKGGAVAIAYAARYPEKVSRLILYGAYARGRFHRSAGREHTELGEVLLKLMRLGWGEDNPAFRQLFATLFLPDADPEQARWFNDLLRISIAPEVAVRLETAAYSLDASGLAPRVSAPTLVLHAIEDAVVPFEEGRLLAGLIPGAHFVPLQSKNHILLADEPAWPRFLAEIRRFLGGEGSEFALATEEEPFPELTQREREVLDLIAQGLNNTQIAQCLVISPKTVRNHITSIFSKLEVPDRARAIILARNGGLGRRGTPEQ